jgi:predicted NBD/HSP70 family sugar kinase
MYIAIDVGGTKTTLASFTELNPNTLVQSITVSTPTHYENALVVFADTITKLQANLTIEHIGISFATRVDSHGQSLTTSNLPDFYHHNLAQDLKLKLHLPVSIKNDAVCAVRAEAAFGAGQSTTRLIHLILGTGVGGAFLYRLPGQIFDLPLEPEFMILYPGGLPHTHYPYKGLAGAYLAGAQLATQVSMPLAEVPDNHYLWDQIAQYLGLLVYNLNLLFTPDMVTFSGGIIRHRPFILEKTTSILQSFQEIMAAPPLILSCLPQNPCLLGALSLCQT